MLRRLGGLAITTLLAVTATPAGLGHAGPTAAGSGARTTVAHLRPVTASGRLKPGYSVTHTFSYAHCAAGSEATGNAYRCFAGKSNHALNRVLDPCWVEGSKRYVVCLANPWSFKVTELTVTKGYDNAGRTTKPARLPWGVQLRNGVQCGFVQGAGAAVGHRRVNYGCAHSPLVLYGAVNRHHRIWTVRSGVPTRTGFNAHGRVGLSAAWFGQASRAG